jgi:hypothetical protein
VKEAMQGNEILADWITDLARDVREQIQGLSPDELIWQPDVEANSIGVTVWHFSRWLDMIAVRALENRPAEEEQWFTRGWAENTCYDPRGMGYAGLGVLTGYTQAEVAAIPPLSANDLLSYLDQVCEALRSLLLAMPPDALHQVLPGLGGKRTPYQWVKPILQGCFGHLGEIECLNAMRARQVSASSSLTANPSKSG